MEITGLEVNTINKKAEILKAYMNENNINVFVTEELKDEHQTVIFRSVIQAESVNLPTLIVTDDTPFTILRVRVAESVIKENNKLAMLEYLNNLNRMYKILKYYILEDNTLILDACILSQPDTIDCELVKGTLDLLVNTIVPEYKKVMKTVWA